MSVGRAWDALLVACAKLVVSGLVLAGGFSAVSDDDYARVVIAQRFAEAPAFDPSGTSWLPLPFWVYGSSFALFGNGLGVARATALFFGVGSVLTVLVAARWFGASRAGTLVAALIAGAFPWSAWLGVATLPEAPTAGLMALGMAALSAEEWRRRTLGALALAAACFCRYEAWPVAAVFATFTLLDGRRRRSPFLILAAAVALAPVGLWLLHGAVRHSDALFFWTRVTSYKHALGGAGLSARGMLQPLWALVREEPALVLGTAVALFVHRRETRGVTRFRAYERGLVCCLSLVVVLSAGELAGGAPTHHAARAILPIWFFLAIVLGDLAGRAHRARYWRLGMGTVVILIFAASLLRPRPTDFAERRHELDIGERARLAGAPRLLVDTPDFGHFAVTAAFGRPHASEPLDDRDPRKPQADDAFASAETLEQRLRSPPGAWLVATRAHAEIARRTGSLRALNERFVLVAPRN